MAGILNIQVKPVVGNKELNLKKVEHYIKKYSDKKLDLVVFPEFFSTGISHEQFEKFPEDENGGETIKFVQELAKKYNTNIVAGTVIEKSEDKLYNTSFIINRKGEIVDKYRKIHLFDYMGGSEGELITAGDRDVVVDLDFGRIGLGICFDIRYPKHFNKLIKKGVDMVILPTAWAIPNEVYDNPQTLQYAQEMWVAMNRTRAYDNMIYFVSCNQTKKANDMFSSIGHSMIVSPAAEVMADAKNDECAIYADIDLDLVKYYRQIYPIAQID